MKTTSDEPTVQFFRVDAGWPHVALFARSNALSPHDTEDCCFIRAGHHIYFATDSSAVAEAVRAQFDLEPIDHIPPTVFDEKPFDKLGNVARYVAPVRLSR
ncbi:MAG: hypothetical protein R3330_00420 [Saprospiraceae bacterium]|nr:hypothetical protein [Saprospiraceae bacterium]